MDKAALQSSYSRLGLRPDASLHDIERAFRKFRDLYREDSLATYSLLSEEERQKKLASVQEAYERIIKARQNTVTPIKRQTQPEHQVSTPAEPPRVIVVAADPQQAPGLFLKQMREARGLSLQDIADQTKIGTTHLQCIENEDCDALPARVYLRGFLKEYCRAVQVADKAAVIESFMTLCKR